MRTREETPDFKLQHSHPKSEYSTKEEDTFATTLECIVPKKSLKKH